MMITIIQRRSIDHFEYNLDDEDVLKISKNVNKSTTKENRRII